MAKQRRNRHKPYDPLKSKHVKKSYRLPGSERVRETVTEISNSIAQNESKWDDPDTHESRRSGGTR